MSRTVEVERHSRRYFLKRGLTAVAAVAAAAVGGKIYGENEVRGQLLLPGDLTPERRAKLETAGYFIYEPKGETIAKMRKSGLVIPSFPLPIPEGQPDPETVPSKRKWIAVKPEFYLPSEEGATPKDLANLVSRQSTTVRTLDGGFQAVPVEVVELLGLDHAYMLETGEESLLSQEGYVITANKVGNNGIAIGRSAPGEPLGYSIFDTSTQNPIPPTDRLQAADMVVAK